MPGTATYFLLAAAIVACNEVGLTPVDGADPAQAGPPAPRDGNGPPGIDSVPILEEWGEPPVEPPAPGDFLFEEGTIHRFDLSLDGAARSGLSGEEDVEATLTYAGEEYLVGMKLKGSFSYRPLSGKAAFKIDFAEFVPGQKFHGLRRLTFNNMVQDRSMIREHVVYHLYRQLGVPAPRHGYAEVWIDGEPYGLYGVLETLDGNWAERVFPRDEQGPIYEGGYGVDLERGDAYKFKLQRQGDLAEPWTDVDALIQELDATPPEAFLGLLEDRFDPALFRMWAVDLAAGHRDGYVNRKNNFMLYHGLNGGRWWMVPWGQDQAMRDGMDVHGNYSGRLAGDCADVPECQARLDAALAYVANVWERWDLHGYAAETGANIAAACERDPRREDPCGYDEVLEFILERPAEIRAELGGGE